MNEMRLKEYTADHVVYSYFPNGKGWGGDVFFDFATKKTEVHENKTEDPIGRLGHYAAKKVCEFVERNNLPIKFIQAWY